MKLMQLIAAVALLAPLAACGGSGSNGGSPDAPASAPTAQPQTVAGVDSDNNGIRDDVDALIASKWSSDKTLNAAISSVARDMQSSLTTDLSANPDTSTALDNEFTVGACATMSLSDAQQNDFAEALKQVYAKTFNTVERIEQRQNFLAAAPHASTAIHLPTNCGGN